MKIAYVRVSTVDQNESRQVEGLKKYDIDRWYQEKVSAKNTNRTELQAMLDFAREGDTIYVWDFSRLARSTKDLLQLVEQMQDKGINLVSVKENLDSSTPTGKLMLTMIGAINEFERANLLERQKEGIQIAKQQGKYKGRKPVEVEEDAFKEQYERYMRREIKKKELADNLKISRPTLDKMIKEYLGQVKQVAEVQQVSRVSEEVATESAGASAKVEHPSIPVEPEEVQLPDTFKGHNSKNRIKVIADNKIGYGRTDNSQSYVVRGSEREYVTIKGKKYFIDEMQFVERWQQANMPDNVYYTFKVKL